MKIPRERVVLNAGFPKYVEEEHLARYGFASRWVKGKRVLDLACGSGYGSKMLAEAGAKSVVGVDLSKEAIAHARRHYAGRTIRYLVGDGEDLSRLGLRDQSFDLAVSFETIEHLRHPESMVREVCRLLKPGGEWIVSSPDPRMSGLLNLPAARPTNPFHVREFRNSELAGLMDRQFTVSECVGQEFVPPALVFWPLELAIKGACWCLRPFGAFRLIEKWYRLRTDILPHKALTGRENWIARYWILRATRRKDIPGHFTNPHLKAAFRENPRPGLA